MQRDKANQKLFELEEGENIYHFFSFLIPVCPGFAIFKEGRVHHRGRASFRHIFKRECFNASVNQINVKFSSCISSIQSAPERDKCPGDPVPD